MEQLLKEVRGSTNVGKERLGGWQGIFIESAFRSQADSPSPFRFSPFSEKRSRTGESRRQRP